jgi:hypothetical protein
VAKTVIKGSLLLTGTVKQLVAEACGNARSTTVPGGEGSVAAQPQQTHEADLQRLTGIGRKYAELLREAGVESIRTLARRNPKNLHEKLLQVNERQQIVSQVPSLELVVDWITQAQSEETSPVHDEA